MDTWRLLKTPPAHGAWNMAVDEAILEAVGGGESLPTLRLYAWDPACLSLGYAQPFTDVDIPRLQKRGWEVVRRPTGGRAVLHTDELTYSVIAPLDEARVAGTVLESYHRLAQALVEALNLLTCTSISNAGSMQVEVHENSPISRSSGTNPVCFEVPSTYEITVGGRKLVGSAQARRKSGVLQHGSLPLSGDLTRILQVLAFSDEEARSLAAERLIMRATTVENALDRKVSWDEAARAIAKAFGDVLALVLHPGDLTPDEKSRAEELVQIKYGHPSWTEKKLSTGI
jgi:lipoyl(octanoyl) transferase